MIESNPIMSADAYTICSSDFESAEAKQNSVYNLTFRRNPIDAFPELAIDSRICVYGIKHYIDKYFNRVATYEDLAKAKAFMDRSHSFGGHLNFPYNDWFDLIKNYEGKLSNVLALYSVQDGQTIFPNMPFLHVMNRMSGYGHLAAHVEARLVGSISVASSAATLCRHWFDRIKDQIKTDLSVRDSSISLFKKHEVEAEQIARFFIHNFGSRACSSEEESTLIGMAHLLTFNGTDNFDAAYNAWLQGAGNSIGTSILALAHRNVQTWNLEEDCFEAIGNATAGQSVRIVSCVADCYNYAKAVEKIIDLAVKRPEIIWVIRPDSGDVFECLSLIYKRCVERGVTKVVNGHHLPLNVRWIEGDSIKPYKMWETFSALRKIGCLPTLWGIFGIGGYIRNNSLRDTLSCAYKVCECGVGKNPVVKLSETEGKLSIPFQTYIQKDMTVSTNLYGTANHVGQYGFSVARETLDRTWAKCEALALANPDYGMNRSHLSDDIRQVQDSFMTKYRS